VVGFQPKKKGSYSIEVTQEGKAIPGSPFRIEVGDGQLCQAGKVHVSGASKEATAMKWNDVHIKLADAGTYHVYRFVRRPTAGECRGGGVCLEFLLDRRMGVPSFIR